MSAALGTKPMNCKKVWYKGSIYESMAEFSRALGHYRPTSGAGQRFAHRLYTDDFEPCFTFTHETAIPEKKKQAIETVRVLLTAQYNKAEKGLHNLAKYD